MAALIGAGQRLTSGQRAPMGGDEAVDRSGRARETARLQGGGECRWRVHGVSGGWVSCRRGAGGSGVGARLRCGAERLDHVGGEPAGGGDPGGTRCGAQAPVGRQHEDEVVDDETGTQSAGPPGAAGRFADRAQSPLLVGGEVHGLGEGRHEGVGEAPAVRVEFADPLDQTLEAVPGVGVRKGVPDGGVAGPPLLGEGLRDQRLLGREVPVRRGRADTACRATSRMGALRPFSPNTARAASSMRARLSRASGEAAGLFRRSAPSPAPTRRRPLGPRPPAPPWSRRTGPCRGRRRGRGPSRPAGHSGCGRSPVRLKVTAAGQGWPAARQGRAGSHGQLSASSQRASFRLEHSGGRPGTGAGRTRRPKPTGTRHGSLRESGTAPREPFSATELRKVRDPHTPGERHDLRRRRFAGRPGPGPHAPFGRRR